MDDQKRIPKVSQGSDQGTRQDVYAEYEKIARQRHFVPETEDDLLQMQQEFYKSGDQPAASVTRVRRAPVIVGSSSSIVSSRAAVQGNDSATPSHNVVDDDDDDDDIPPPLEKDVVSLGDDLPESPPTIQPSSIGLRAGSRFLQDRANKGPRTHFRAVGERFDINLDDDENGNDTNDTDKQSPLGSHLAADDAETEEETRQRLRTAGPSMGQILNEVLEKPVVKAVAPTVPTTTFGSLNPPPRSTSNGAAKGGSLFARRLAEAQKKHQESSASTSTTSGVPEPTIVSTVRSTSSSTTRKFPASADHVPPTDVEKVTLGQTLQHAKASAGIRKGTPSTPRSAPALHSVLKKSADTSHGTLMEQIDDENRRKLSGMTDQEIEKEREELLRQLDPELVAKLLKRNTVQRRVSFSEGISIEGKVVSMQDARVGRDHAGFEAKRHQEEEGDHPLALKAKYYSDVPAEPEKMEWMGIEDPTTEYKAPGKAITPGVQPYTVQENDPPAAHLRFDFSGKILGGQDVPVHLGLHHHGVDPTKAGYTLSELLHLVRSTVPSQRILPLNILAKILRNCRNPDLAPFETRSGILRWLIDRLRAPVYLRAALDDKTDSGVVAAVNVIHAWIQPEDNLGQATDVWDTLDLLYRGHERINLGFKRQTITRFANMELKSDTLRSSQEQAEAEETIGGHAALASKEPVEGLVAMDIFPRLRYILAVCQLPAPTNVQVIDILITLARFSPEAVKGIFECEGLLSALVGRFAAITWPSELNDLELCCTSKVITLLDIVIRSSRKIASAVIEEGHVEPFLRFLALTPEATASNKQSFIIQTQALKLFRSLASYGLYCNVMVDILHPVLLQDIAQTITNVSRPIQDQDPVVKSFLSKKLTIFFQLGVSWIHASVDGRRTIPESSLYWAQAIAFLDMTLDGLSKWTRMMHAGTFDLEQTLLVAGATRYIGTWARYLTTFPLENDQLPDRVWDALCFYDWTASAGFQGVHTRLISLMEEVPHLDEPALPHVGITLSNPSSISKIAHHLLEFSLCCEFLNSHHELMYHFAQHEMAPANAQSEMVKTLISESVIGLVEQVTKYELAIQDQIPATLPPWIAFIGRHGVYLVAQWLRAMDVFVYQQDPQNSSHIKLTLFPIFQVTALSLLQIVLPGDESLSYDVLLKILFSPRVLGKLLNQNSDQITAVERILKPLYLQCFVKSHQELKRSQSVWNHEGCDITTLVVNYGSISSQPLFNWLFYPIDILYKSKLTYVEESGVLIAATSVIHCVLDFVYSLLQTLDGIAFELIYMASLKVLMLEGERQPGRSEGAEEEEFEDEESGPGEQEQEEDGFMDTDVDGTINRLMDHFSTHGDSVLVRDGAKDLNPASEKILSLLTNPIPFEQFMKDFMENCFTTGTLLQFQSTAARLLFPAMAISPTLNLLIWRDSYSSLGSMTTRWEDLDTGSLRSLLLDDDAVTTERNPALYWIAVHHLARFALGPIKMPPPPRSGGMRSQAAAAVVEPKTLTPEESLMEEERRSIVKAVVAGTKSEELVRDWIQYDARNYEHLAQAPLGGGIQSFSRPLSLLSTSNSFPMIGSRDYLDSDNILTPPECFCERRQILMTLRKEWAEMMVGEEGMERIERSITAGAGWRRNP
ncbi:RNA polymerase II associated protein 1 [Lunasporangiospora selenospora]|uniref:RNA polymerase II associated protein 1 n=1 Tax=Lunasporangiospora selenospora TaxID=979761 RepID=A0A9P6KF64_9FUNG|nr:RNA polymerase II associated protein 1 [Lunasporangiospora selenospora]